MSTEMLRRYAAEFMGTFALIFFGCGTRVMVGDTHEFAGILMVHMSFAFAIGLMIYSVSNISGAHFNPAITFGFALSRHFPWRYVIPYWIAQFAGAICASLLHLLFLGDKAIAVHFGATEPKIPVLQSLGIEIVLTFFLMLVSMAVATDRRNSKAVAGIAVPFTILISGLFANFLTGGSMNPARSLGPALVAGTSTLSTVWIYFVAPVIGATIASLVYEAIRGKSSSAKGVPEELAPEKLRTAKVQQQEKSAMERHPNEDAMKTPH